MSMKAPHEVWVDGEDAYTTASTDERQRIRYLRANLTCGECDSTVGSCPHKGDAYIEDPACMAFVPKEER